MASLLDHLIRQQRQHRISAAKRVNARGVFALGEFPGDHPFLKTHNLVLVKIADVRANDMRRSVRSWLNAVSRQLDDDVGAVAIQAGHGGQRGRSRNRPIKMVTAASSVSNSGSEIDRGGIGASPVRLVQRALHGVERRVNLQHMARRGERFGERCRRLDGVTENRLDDFAELGRMGGRKKNPYPSSLMALP